MTVHVRTYVLVSAIHTLTLCMCMIVCTIRSVDIYVCACTPLQPVHMLKFSVQQACKVRVVRSYFCLPFTAESPPPLTVGPAEVGATCQPSMSSAPAAGS